MQTDTLTIDDWAIICTIHQVPQYQFVGSELRAARRMAKAGSLREAAGKRFKMTRTGERRYKEGFIS